MWSKSCISFRDPAITNLLISPLTVSVCLTLCRQLSSSRLKTSGETSFSNVISLFFPVQWRNICRLPTIQEVWFSSIDNNNSHKWKFNVLMNKIRRLRLKLERYILSVTNKWEIYIFLQLCKYTQTWKNITEYLFAIIRLTTKTLIFHEWT